MNTIELSPLHRNAAEFQRGVLNLRNKFQCDWNDAVHESFRPFIKTMGDHAETVRRINEKAAAILQDIESCGVDALCAAAQELASEAETI